MPGTAEATLRWLIKEKLEANLEVMTDDGNDNARVLSRFHYRG